MKSHGQFCAVARALEVLGERWTILIVRELLMGSSRFGEIQRGIPRISKTMLSARLHELCDARVIERREGQHGPEYVLTQAGLELQPVVETLGVWGQRWTRWPLTEAELDLDVLLWDLRRRVRTDALPGQPIVLRLHLRDLRPPHDERFVLLRREEVSLCAENPGFETDVTLRTDVQTLIAWWRGDTDWSRALRSGAIVASGSRNLVRQLPGWFDRYLFADVAAAE